MNMQTELLTMTLDIKIKYREEAEEKIHKLFDVLVIQKKQNNINSIVKTQEKLIICLVKLSALQDEIMDIQECLKK